MFFKPSLGLAIASLFVAYQARADVFTNVPEAADFQLVYTLPVPAIQGSYNSTSIPYAVNNAASFPGGTFTRIGYYLELSGSTDPTRKNGFVFVSFDRPAALPNGGSIGVPSNGPNGSKVITNTVVANMNVVSNIPGITTGTGLPGGKIEFWPSGYVTGANGVYDHDDSGFDASSGHGSMQIHNAAAGQTLIGYNDWGGTSPGTPSEIGAGPNLGTGQPDWTFSNSGTAYTVRSLQILVKPTPNLVPITNASFEIDPIVGGGAPVFEVRATGPTGWSYSGPNSQGLISPDAGEPNTFYNGATSGYSGSKAHFAIKSAASDAPRISQTLTSTLQANTTYTLSLQVGNRTNGDGWGGHHIALKTTSGTIVGEWVGGNTEPATDGKFAKASRKFTTGANPPGLGEPLQVVIQQPVSNLTSRYLDFDDVVMTADPAPARPVGTPIDVMIVSGQSNAQGWQTDVNTLSPGFRPYADSPSPDAFLAYKQNAYGQPIYLSGSVGQLSPIGCGFAGNFDGFGPELSAGTDLADRLENKVAVIKFASGGAGLNAHFKKSANNLYPMLIAQINSSMAALTAQGFAPAIKGFFWLQGESDATDPAAAPLYGANITQFVTDLRTDLSAPALKVVLTEINPNMPALQGANASGTALVNSGMQTLATADPNVEFVTTSDITSGFGDTIHYSANQTITIGQRWANAYQPAPPPPPAPTIFDRVPEAGAEGYQVLYQLDIPADGGFQNATPVPYTVNNSLTALPYDRVAYYLELTKPDGSSQWVYASIDAFTSTASQLGLPHNLSNPVVQQRLVANMNVYSNVPGVVTGHSLDGGSIEMWSNSYNMGRGGLFHAGDGGNYDWDDTRSTAADFYGSFQVHNPVARQVVFGYNRWASADGTPDDVGIGNQVTGHRDHTFAGNSGNFTARRLVILTRPGNHVTFSAAPKNSAVVARNPATNLATIPIAGTEAEAGYDNVVLRIYRNGVFQNEQVQPLAYAGTAPFSFNPQIPAELASYDFEVLLEKAGQRRLVRRIADVCAGDIYLVYGQSNSEAGFAVGNVATGQSTSSNGYLSPWVRTFGQNADSGTATRNNLSWVQASGDGMGSTYVDPGAIGQWALVLGSKIVAEHRIPVAVINGGRGGYSMPQLQKDDLQPDNLDDAGATTRTYNRLRYRAIQGGFATTARAILFYQGESENDNSQVHADGYAGLRADWLVDYPGLQRFHEVQIHVGCGCSQGNVALRQTQRSFGDSYPNTSLMATNGLQSHDGCHYLFINGYETLGTHFFRQFSRDYYGGPDGPDIDPLNPLEVRFTGTARSQIRVTMRDPGATINFPVGALADFVLTGTPAMIVGCTVSGNSFTLELSAPAIGDVRLEYRGHIGGGDFVTNANGVGLLSFSEAVGPIAPRVNLLSPAASQSANVGDTLSVAATASAGSAGPATRMEFLVNGVELFEANGASLNTSWQVTSAGAHLLEVRAFDAVGEYGTAKVTVFAGAATSPGGVTAGLQVWLKAETGVVKDLNGMVSSWLDQSGNLNHVSQATAGAQPRLVEGLFGIAPGLQFDGNDALSSNTGMPTGSYTKIVRFALDSHVPLNNLISSSTSGNTGARDHALYYSGESTAKMFHSGTFATATIATPVNTTAVLTGIYDTATNLGSLYLNNQPAGTGSSAGDNTVAGFQIGAYVNSAHLLGRVAEVLIYNRVLTAGERDAVHGYLNDKYQTPYGLWIKSHYGQAGPMNDDTDQDGLETAVEYALGLNPMVSDSNSPRLPQIVRSGDSVEVTYQRAVDHPDVILHLERSSDLLDWAVVGDSSMGVAGNLDTRRHAAMVPAGTSRNFYRLKATIP